MFRSGIELNELIAEHVMGWRRCDTFHDQDRTKPVTFFLAPGIGRREERLIECPPFSTDWSAAGLVVEHVCTAMACNFKICGQWFQVGASFYKLTAGRDIFWDRPPFFDYVVGNGVPHAICLAALKKMAPAIYGTGTQRGNHDGDSSGIVGRVTSPDL